MTSPNSLPCLWEEKWRKREAFILMDFFLKWGWCTAISLLIRHLTILLSCYQFVLFISSKPINYSRILYVHICRNKVTTATRMNKGKEILQKYPLLEGDYSKKRKTWRNNSSKSVPSGLLWISEELVVDTFWNIRDVSGI